MECISKTILALKTKMVRNAHNYYSLMVFAFLIYCLIENLTFKKNYKKLHYNHLKCMKHAFFLLLFCQSCSKFTL
jgi:hypothetical protein